MKILHPFTSVCLLIGTLVVSACSHKSESGEVYDPLEPMNRKVHAFNRGFDTKLVKPLTSGSDDADKQGTARPSVTGKTVELVGNFGENLALPGKVVNHLLQGKPAPAVKNTFRFLINSSLGGAGLFDPASADFALPEQDTDFGETLAVWGVGEGPYLELPLLGPSTVRDAFGKVVDVVADPLQSRLNTDQMWIAYGARAASKAGDRGKFGDSIDSILYGSADSYAQIRLMYLQHRRHELGEEGEAIDPYAE